MGTSQNRLDLCNLVFKILDAYLSLPSCVVALRVNATCLLRDGQRSPWAAEGPRLQLSPAIHQEHLA